MMGMLAALAGKGSNPVAALGGELLGLKTTGDLFVGILQSRSVEDDVISKFDLRKVYGDKRWDDARKDLARRVNIGTDRKSGIITIEVSDRSPQRAQQMGQEYVSVLNQVVTTLNTSSAHRERVFLEERLNGVQQDLESAEQDFSQFASKNTTIDLQAEGKAMIEAGAMLAGQLVAAQTELEGLRQIYTNNNVRIRSVQARVDELRRQLEKLGGQAGGDPAAGQDAGALYPPIRKLPLLGVRYADLYRRTKVQEAVFETLTQEYELAKVQEAKETPSVKVLDPADFPERESFFSRLLIIFGGTLVAAVLGGAMVVGNKRWQEINPNDPGKVFASEVFSAVRAQMPRVFSRNGSAGRNGNGS
jgi:capsule polysaccharide export protein KpsE/RkpR